jgi:hypothetical protein
MKKYLMTGMALILLAVSVFVGGGAARAKDTPKLIEFESMVGVPKAYTAPMNNPIRGINGGGLPWVVQEAEGSLSQTGEVRIKIKGLVFDPTDPTVIARGLANTNPVAAFKAIVSCQSVDASGAATVVNVSTNPFPATVGLKSAGGGNSVISQTISLPKPCLAPIVFVTSPGGAWFAVIGQ